MISAPPVLDDLDQLGPLFEHNPVPMLAFSLDDLQILRANQAAADLYGWTVDELASMSMTQIRPPDEVPAFLQVVARVQAEVDGVYRLGAMVDHWGADGRTIPVEVSWTPLVVGGRRMRVAFIIDQTVRVEAEAERNRSVHRLMALQEEMHHRIAERLHDGPVQTLTAASLRIGLLRRTADAELAPKLVSIEELVIDALQALRREMDEQRAPAEIATDFAGSIRSIVAHYGLQGHVAVRAVGGDPPPATAALLYRVAQRVLSESELDRDVDDPWVIDIEVDDAAATLRIPVHRRSTVDQHLVDWTRPVQGEVHRATPGDDVHLLVVTIPVDTDDAVNAPAEGAVPTDGGVDA